MTRPLGRLLRGAFVSFRLGRGDGRPGERHANCPQLWSTGLCSAGVSAGRLVHSGVEQNVDKEILQSLLRAPRGRTRNLTSASTQREPTGKDPLGGTELTDPGRRGRADRRTGDQTDGATLRLTDDDVRAAPDREVDRSPPARGGPVRRHVGCRDGAAPSKRRRRTTGPSGSGATRLGSSTDRAPQGARTTSRAVSEGSRIERTPGRKARPSRFSGHPGSRTSRSRPAGPGSAVRGGDTVEQVRLTRPTACGHTRRPLGRLLRGAFSAHAHDPRAHDLHAHDRTGRRSGTPPTARHRSAVRTSALALTRAGA